MPKFERRVMAHTLGSAVTAEAIGGLWDWKEVVQKAVALVPDGTVPFSLSLSMCQDEITVSVTWEDPEQIGSHFGPNAILSENRERPVPLPV